MLIWLGLICCLGVQFCCVGVFYVRVVLFELFWVILNSVGIYVFARYLDDFCFVIFIMVGGCVYWGLVLRKGYACIFCVPVIVGL